MYNNYLTSPIPSNSNQCIEAELQVNKNNLCFIGITSMKGFEDDGEIWKNPGIHCLYCSDGQHLWARGQRTKVPNVTGDYFMKTTWQPYGVKYGANDVVFVQVNFSQNWMQFSVNGIKQNKMPIATGKDITYRLVTSSEGCDCISELSRKGYSR